MWIRRRRLPATPVSDLLGATRSKLDEIYFSPAIRLNSKEVVSLSIVVPAYNEWERLPKTIFKTIAWCNQNKPSCEIIIVDDGSADDTLELGRLFSEYDSRVRIISCAHRGKGAAVRTGMLSASGSSVLYMDADGAAPLTEIPKLLLKIEEGFPVVIGSRVVRHPGETTVKTVVHRRIIGRIFAALVNLFVIAGIADTQCGFKIFTRKAAQQIFICQKINGFAFDTEILYLAKKLGFSIAEVSINWVNQKGSKVNLITDSVQMFRDTLKIRYLHRNREKHCPRDFSAL